MSLEFGITPLYYETSLLPSTMDVTYHVDATFISDQEPLAS
jgi:hypothetical protein